MSNHPSPASTASGKAKVLLISGYDAASHRHWRNTLETWLNHYEWTQIALPDRYYAWRIRGNGYTLAEKFAEQLSQSYHCLIVTSMVDLNSLRGFCPHLAKLPTIVYCHENQFVYPSNDQAQEQANRLNAQLSAIFSMINADSVIFNSQYNQQTFLSGAKKLFKKLPDGVSVSSIDEIERKSSVLAVPIEGPIHELALSKKPVSAEPPDPFSHTVPLRILERPAEYCCSVVWNHRWEFDKQAEVFFDAISLLKARGITLQVNVLGQSFRKIPQCFEQAKLNLKEQIQVWGYQPKDTYHQVLMSADIVVSTALHDFQGLSMLEAISRGCLPVAPNRVAYPEYIDQQFLYQVEQGQPEAEALANKLQWVIENRHGLNQSDCLRQQQNCMDYYPERLIPKYQKLIDSLLQIDSAADR